MIKGNIKIGNASIQIEAETQVGLVEQAGFWGEVPTSCGHCNSNNIGFFSRSPSGNLYVGMKCKEKECGYELNFGQNKEGGRLFMKHDEGWKAPWKPDGEQASSAPATSNVAPEDDDDIPF
jgi:hypothetical protein